MLAFIIILAVFIFIWKLTPNPANKRAAGMMFQMLESFSIIENTTKFDVFTRRLDFLGTLANTMPKISDKKKCIDSVLFSYSRKYPAVSVSPTIIAILNQPQIAISEKFRDEAATAFFLRACYKLKNDIRTLKTMAAKQRRYIQAAELADVIIDRLKSNVRQRYIDCINNELSNILNLISTQPPPISGPNRGFKRFFSVFSALKRIKRLLSVT